MFTGIVAELGEVVRVEESGEIEISAIRVLDGLGVGDSVAVNGCCLTAVRVASRTFTAHAVAETRSRTNLRALAPGDPVNLERPLRADGLLDGHLVQGHVDGVGRVVEPSPDLEVSADPSLLGYLVEKGSVTVDGVSLTVVSVGDTSFRVAVIPHTAEVTTLGRRAPGDLVNLEVDIVAKYVERLLSQAGRIEG